MFYTVFTSSYVLVKLVECNNEINKVSNMFDLYNIKITIVERYKQSSTYAYRIDVI